MKKRFIEFLLKILEKLKELEVSLHEYQHRHGYKHSHKE